MKRITPEEVLEAYEATGLRPVARNFYHGNDDDVLTCACPIGVLYIARHPHSACHGMDDYARDWAESTYGDDYAEGFISGVDGYSDCRKPCQEGYDDGRACWNAVKHLCEAKA